MLILLPPSETKRSGGRKAALSLEKLGFGELNPVRERVLSALVAASSGDQDAAARVLGLGKTQHGDLEHNTQLWSAPTLPAIMRYTGVLFDALGAESCDAAARQYLRRNVAIHSAPFGLVRAGDHIPNYRMGAAVRLPGLAPLKTEWARAGAEALSRAKPGFVLDLRSEAYVALTLVPASLPSAYVRIVTRGPDGVARALNHFNKHSKGVLLRELASMRPRISSPAAFVQWARTAGWEPASTNAGVIELAART